MGTPLMEATASLANTCFCCSSSGLVLTSAVDARSSEVSNAISVSKGPRYKNGIGVRILSSSPVMVVKGEPLGPTNLVSLS